jgi:hypothetical protein
MSAVRLLLFSLFVLSATGCVAPHQLAPPPAREQTPERVNAALEGKRATVELWSGDSYEQAEEIRVSNDSLHFVQRERVVDYALALDDVREIWYVRGRKANRSALIGAVPGGAMFVGGLMTEMGGNQGFFKGRVFILAGIGYVAIGSTVGALIGQWTAPGERVIVYQTGRGGREVELETDGAAGG